MPCIDSRLCNNFLLTSKKRSIYNFHKISKRRPVIGKNQNTFAKLQRDRRKKMKAEEKRQRRLNRKSGKSSPASIANNLVDIEQGSLVVTESSAPNQLIDHDSVASDST